MTPRIFFLFIVAGLIALPTHAQTDTNSYRDQVEKSVNTVMKAQDLEQKDGFTNSVLLKSGPMRYRHGGFRSKNAKTEESLSLDNGVNFANAALEFEWYRSRNVATVLGYRTAYNTDTKRTQYQAGIGGARYFPYTTGAPLRATRSFSQIQYDFKMKPFVGGGVGLGRYLAAVFGKDAALDVSSEFYAVYSELGVKFPINQRTGVDLGASYEYAKGYGPILFEAYTLFMQAGVHYYY